MRVNFLNMKWQREAHFCAKDETNMYFMRNGMHLLPLDGRH